jgi:hypothetical protein
MPFLRGGPSLPGVCCCGCGFSALLVLAFLLAGGGVLPVLSSSLLSEELEEEEEKEEEETALFLLRTVRFLVGTLLSSESSESLAWLLFGSGLRATPFLREGSGQVNWLGR